MAGIRPAGYGADAPSGPGERRVDRIEWLIRIRDPVAVAVPRMRRALSLVTRLDRAPRDDRAGGSMAGRLRSWLLALALAAPLVAISAWVIHGATHPPVRRPAPGEPAGAWPGLPRPIADLPSERLEERVDGAAFTLRAEGCRRLVLWRFEEPPADAEALFFATAEGARAVLGREAGASRTPGPGDEAQVEDQAVYFRRGTVLVRLFLDPGATPPPGGLAARADEIDRALLAGGRGE
jgi:hypothetical protein